MGIGHVGVECLKPLVDSREVGHIKGSDSRSGPTQHEPACLGPKDVHSRAADSSTVLKFHGPIGVIAIGPKRRSKGLTVDADHEDTVRAAIQAEDFVILGEGEGSLCAIEPSHLFILAKFNGLAGELFGP